MGGNVISAGWQVTLCGPMWHVSSLSGVATLRTAVHLLLTYVCSVNVEPTRVRGYHPRKTFWNFVCDLVHFDAMW